MERLIWLTGASSGIGEAFARVAAQEGYSLALTARNAESLHRLVEACQGEGRVVASFPGDVTDRGEMARVAEAIRSQLGEISLLVANAGTHIPTDVRRFDVMQYETLMRVNYFGVLNCIEAVLPRMLEQNRGHLVAVSSVAGYRGLPRAAAYGASKAALTHFMESLRLDLDRTGIVVTVVSPGFVRTPLTDKNDFTMPFLMEADDAARAMLQGIAQKQMEVHFPKRFTYLLKLLRVLPYPLYHRLIASKVSPS
ncbi:MAG: SDR family NAD(P)-dependent oxidoreductase [Bdellovibrionales bacterium]|nr:SDR family NAD(P)-dependent oxidoreductase [Bdellovibrionales bacterium]